MLNVWRSVFMLNLTAIRMMSRFMPNLNRLALFCGDWIKIAKPERPSERTCWRLKIWALWKLQCFFFFVCWWAGPCWIWRCGICSFTQLLSSAPQVLPPVQTLSVRSAVICVCVCVFFFSPLSLVEHMLWRVFSVSYINIYVVSLESDDRVLL